MAMNVFLQAPILGCVFEIVCDKMSEAERARESESCPAGGHMTGSKR